MTLKEYSQLKRRMVLEISNSIKHNELLEMLKELFKHEINSPRRMEDITTIGKLLEVLEIRDVLSTDNVKILKNIAKNLPNSKELVSEIESYEKSLISKPVINIYAEQLSRPLYNAKSTDTSYIKINPYSNLSQNKKDMIFERIIEEIGIYWRDLGRNLGVRECFIDEVEATCETVDDKASKILQRYEQRSNPDKWFFVLCRALEKCRRKDLSEKIQEIMSYNI